MLPLVNQSFSKRWSARGDFNHCVELADNLRAFNLQDYWSRLLEGGTRRYRKSGWLFRSTNTHTYRNMLTNRYKRVLIIFMTHPSDNALLSVNDRKQHKVGLLWNPLQRWNTLGRGARRVIFCTFNNLQIRNVIHNMNIRFNFVLSLLFRRIIIIVIIFNGRHHFRQSVSLNFSSFKHDIQQ